jgi:hypothetical protein
VPKVILVGSSPAVMDQELGAKIDEFDVVIRFNAYQLKDYEKHIGSKETVWAVNLGLAKHLQTVSRYMARPNNYLWYVGNNFDMEILFLKVKKALKKQFVVESLNYGYVDYVNKSLAKDFKKENLCFERNKLRVGPRKRYATTGLRGIVKALQRYDNVTIHGFTSFQESKGEENSQHYYTIDNVPRHMHAAFKRDANHEHDVDTEKRVIDKMLNIGLINKLQ